MPPLSRTTAPLRLLVEFDLGKLVILLNSITLALNYTFQHKNTISFFHLKRRTNPSRKRTFHARHAPRPPSFPLLTDLIPTHAGRRSSNRIYMVTSPLLVAQTFDGIELGGADSRNGAEQNADQRAHDDGDDRGETGNRNAIGGEEADGVGDGESDDDAEDAADEGDENGLGKELEADLAFGGANRFADADLANTGADGGEHDVHDADAADQQYHRRNQQQHHGQNVRRPFRQVHQWRQVLHVVDRLRPVPRLQDPLDLSRRCCHFIRARHREIHLAHSL